MNRDAYVVHEAPHTAPLSNVNIFVDVDSIAGRTYKVNWDGTATRKLRIRVLPGSLLDDPWDLDVMCQLDAQTVWVLDDAGSLPGVRQTAATLRLVEDREAV